MKFLVIGDSCTDKFIYGKCERMCPEAPVPILNPIKTVTGGGMAKNVQSNVIALGADCDIITNSNEILKTRYVDIKTNQMLLRVDTNDRSTDSFNIEEVDFKKYDAVLVSNYGKGFLADSAINKICLKHDNVFYDSKTRLKYDIPINLKIIKLNQYEIDLNYLIKHANNEAEDDGRYNRPSQVIVTYGHRGCKYMGKMYSPPKKIISQDPAGAGDTFLAALATSMTKGSDVIKAIKFAQECASSVVTKKGVVTV